MCALFDDPATFHDENAVRVGNGAEPVSDHKRCAAGHQRFEALSDEPLAMDALAAAIRQVLEQEPPRHDVDLDGAGKTPSLLASVMKA